MATNETVTRENNDKGRRGRWTAPAVTRLAAGAAENGSGPTSDDPINHS
jgi:hypothetical protein